MERTEEEPVKKSDTDESFNNIDWLWAHISSQLIYFVLFQYASFPNIVTTLHDKVIYLFLVISVHFTEIWFIYSWLQKTYEKVVII